MTRYATFHSRGLALAWSYQEPAHRLSEAERQALVVRALAAGCRRLARRADRLANRQQRKVKAFNNALLQNGYGGMQASRVIAQAARAHLRPCEEFIRSLPGDWAVIDDPLLTEK